MDGPTPLLAMRGIGKRFGAVQANRDVELTLLPGDILGLLGENGAGKTTLMNILFGTYSPDEGRIEIDGRPVEIHNSAAAIVHGIGMVHQHFHLVPHLNKRKLAPHDIGHGFFGLCLVNGAFGCFQ